MVNDSKKGNGIMKKIIVDGCPKLVIFALNDIDVNCEVRYDYGDTENLWWRDKVISYQVDCIYQLYIVTIK